MNKQIEAEDTMTGIIEYKNPHAMLTYQVTTSMPFEDKEASIQLFGNKGSIIIDGIALNQLSSFESTDRLDKKDWEFNNSKNEVPNGYGFGHKRLLISILNELNGGVESISSSVLYHTTADLINSIYLSSESNKWVYLPNHQDNNLLGK